MASTKIATSAITPSRRFTQSARESTSGIPFLGKAEREVKISRRVRRPHQ